MSVVSRATLKGYFTTRSVVDESDITNFVDSMSHNDEDERSISVFIEDPNVFVGEYIIIMQPERSITITHYSVMNDGGGPTMTHKLVTLDGGGTTDITANSTTVGDILVDSSFPTITIASATVIAGKHIAIVTSGAVTSPNTTFTVRYKDA